MFDKFTPNAKKVFDRARIHAKVNSHSEVRSAHVLLGMLAEDECVAAKILMGAIPAEKLMAAAKKAVDAFPKESDVAKKEVSYGADVKILMDRSFAICEQLQDGMIASEHILMAFFDKGNPIGELIESFGVKGDDLVTKAIEAGMAPAPASAATAAKPPSADGTHVGVVAVLEEGLTEEETSRIMVAISQLRGVSAIDVMNVRFKPKGEDLGGIVPGRMKMPFGDIRK